MTIKRLDDGQIWWRDQLALSINGGIVASIALGSWVLSSMGEVDYYYLYMPKNTEGLEDPYADVW